MTELYSMLNEAVADLVMKTQPVFENWCDANAERFKNDCIDGLRRSHKQYMDELNVRLKVLMKAEKQITDDYNRICELRK